MSAPAPATTGGHQMTAAAATAAAAAAAAGGAADQQQQPPGADDLWRECSAWLTRCQLIPADHKANWPDSQIHMLAKLLRDGVLLCNLINFLHPGAIGDFNRKPQLAQFLCCQNIKTFQEACRTHFALRESDMFEPMALYNLQDFYRVLVCLSKLSRSDRVAQLHPQIQGYNVQLQTGERSQSEEDIYKDLQSTILLNNNRTDSPTPKSTPTASSPSHAAVAVASHNYANIGSVGAGGGSNGAVGGSNGAGGGSHSTSSCTSNSTSSPSHHEYAEINSLNGICHSSSMIMPQHNAPLPPQPPPTVAAAASPYMNLPQSSAAHPNHMAVERQTPSPPPPPLPARRPKLPSISTTTENNNQPLYTVTLAPSASPTSSNSGSQQQQQQQQRTSRLCSCSGYMEATTFDDMLPAGGGAAANDGNGSSLDIETGDDDDDDDDDMADVPPRSAAAVVPASRTDSAAYVEAIGAGSEPIEVKWCNESVFNADDWQNNERAYEDLCYVTFASAQLTASTSNFEQRDFVIRELLDTETNYLEVLNALQTKFMEPLEQLLGKDSAQLRQIFPRIPELAAIHRRFLQKLRDATAAPPKCKLSSVFLEFREPFLVYGEYCSNMTNAMDTLLEVARRPDVDQVIQRGQKEHSGGRSQLRDILSVPMQRILKYHLLLDKLVEKTSPNHDDYRGLERSKEAMVDVAQYTNEVKRDSEHLVVIEKIRESIVDLNLPNGNDLKQYGRFLHDGELNIKAHEDQKMKHRYAFIFEKLLILVKVKTSTMRIADMEYTFRDAHNLADYRVEAVHSRRTLGRDARFKYQMLLARKTQSTAFTLYMKTEADRDKWTLKLQEAMETLEPLGSRNSDHKFAVTTFETPVICLHCSKFLKGLLHQGYRCKVCEICVHKQCIMSTSRCKQAQSAQQAQFAQPPPVCDRQLSEFYWFVGSMERDMAQARLLNRKTGTYLLRVRPQGASNAMETMYALSLKTDERTVKHMKINQKTEGDQLLFYLSSRRHFKTIVELVSFYERNDLGENFAGLNQSLQWPFREMVATALYDFNPTEPNQLPLRQGFKVLVIGKEGDSKGWWRGKTQERVGFFPKDYVMEHPPGVDEL